MMNINLIIWIIAYPLIAFFVGVLLLGYSRKFNARVQRRIGPPVTQTFYDIMKLMRKITNISHGYMHDFAVMMLVGGTLLTLFFIPVPGFHYFVKYGDMLVIMYVILIPSLGMALGVGETANPNGSIGVSRGLMLMVGYEVAFTTAFIGLSIVYNTTSLLDFARYQAGGILHWNLIRHPFLGIAGLIALQGMMGEKPFETFIAPAEIASGPMVEMGGKYLGMMIIQHALSVFIELSIYINMFLGGAVNWIDFLVKLFVLFTVVLSINVVFGRYRTDDAIKFMWKYPVIFGIIGIIIAMI